MKKVSKHRMVMKKQVQQVFFERDILAFAENPFVVGLWCTFQSKVGPALISAHLATAVQCPFQLRWYLSFFLSSTYMWQFWVEIKH